LDLEKLEQSDKWVKISVQNLHQSSSRLKDPNKQIHLVTDMTLVQCPKV